MFYLNLLFFRFSPQLEQQSDKAHELSTIIELDTPATSRINMSLDIPEAKSEPHIETSLNTQMAMKIQQFPPSQTLADDVLMATVTTSTIINNSTEEHLKIQKFVHHKEWASGNVSGLCDTASIEAAGGGAEDVVPNSIEFKPFPTHQEYAAGVSGLCDSVSVAAANTAAAENLTFPDIEAELKLRKIISRSFESLKFVSSSEDDDAEQQQPSKTTTKHTHRQLLMHSSSSDNLEQEMAKVGLNWASAMIKKTNDLKRLTSSSSSTSAGKLDPPATVAPANSFVDPNLQKAIKENEKIINNSSSSSPSAGRPLNLNEFLTRELLRKTVSSPSSTNDDSTLASQFLRSLLGSSDSASSSSTRHIGLLGAAHVSENHRTSTPVKLMSSTTTTTAVSQQKSHHHQRLVRSPPTDNYLFSAESVLSSVRGSSGTSRNSPADGKNDGERSSVEWRYRRQFDALSVPDFKLNLPPPTTTEQSSTNSS